MAYAERHEPGVLRFDTPAGLVEVSTQSTSDGAITARLISVTVPIADDGRGCRITRW